jgi:putative lipoprotein (rSAM/lipoprotein system)
VALKADFTEESKEDFWAPAKSGNKKSGFGSPLCNATIFCPMQRFCRELHPLYVSSIIFASFFKNIKHKIQHNMKKFNRKFIKGTNWALAGLISLIGYSSCEDEVNYPRDEYGTPYAKFIVSGKVTDTEQQGLKNIRVVVPKVDHHQRATSGFIPDQKIITNEVHDTLYTKENGNFEYEYTGIPTNDSINVILQFEEVAETPRFESDSAKVTFFSSELREGDGWYEGAATKEIEIRLKKKGE